MAAFFLSVLNRQEQSCTVPTMPSKKYNKLDTTKDKNGWGRRRGVVCHADTAAPRVVLATPEPQ
jgi:hypothetical protein